MNKARIIAFYLPQFHPTEENDIWWGKGFTEWTNVGNAKSLFRGHYQPRVPADLGYYDLRIPEVREQQAQLAQEAGIEGFCYWHYWFGNGKRLLERPFNEVLNSGKPDYPFCLGWANHSWYAKTWKKDGTSNNSLLIEQIYPGMDEAKSHFSFLLRSFKDKRYILVDGKPFFYVFDPLSLPVEYVSWFKQWTIEAGFKGLYLVANLVFPFDQKEKLLSNGYDAFSYQRLGSPTSKLILNSGRIGRGVFKVYQSIKGFIMHRPARTYDYKKYYKYLVTSEECNRNTIPVLIPQWDHTPRSGMNGNLFINSTPDIFYKHALDAINAVENKPEEERLILLKSWNEWGEGNYMEPDLKYGKQYIYALQKAQNVQL